MKRRKLFSQRNAFCYFMAVWARRAGRYAKWYLDSKRYAKKRSAQKLPFRVKKHQSVLIRKLGESDMRLQINKVTNLKIAISKINGILIKPKETFSFCRLVGLPTKSRGYLEGMELSFGKARAGIGGGLCQISNLIYWLAIHSPLTVVERYHHSFDPFPDDGRVLPFGSGATIFYNYRDFQFTNNTDFTFQINLWISEKCLEGELRSSQELEHSYHIFEKDHQFLKIGDQFYRKNEIWLNKTQKVSGETVESNLITKNFARVMYEPQNYSVE
ncbi:MAG: VanW family protein [Helicobacteraceae bacterium]|jgi:vancomycin resistance protein VanW|nr:VanW family protein [Helicobacteraceae bacterium]